MELNFVAVPPSQMTTEDSLHAEGTELPPPSMLWTLSLLDGARDPWQG